MGFLNMTTLKTALIALVAVGVAMRIRPVRDLISG